MPREMFLGIHTMREFCITVLNHDIENTVASRIAGNSLHKNLNTKKVNHNRDMDSRMHCASFLHGSLRTNIL